MFPKQEGKAVRLLPVELAAHQMFRAAVLATAVDQIGNHHLAQGLERVMIAKERALGGDHRLDDLTAQTVARIAAQLSDQLADRVQVSLAEDRREPAFDEVLLVRVEKDRAALIQQLADHVEILVRHGITGG